MVLYKYIKVMCKHEIERRATQQGDNTGTGTNEHEWAMKKIGYQKRVSKQPERGSNTAAQQTEKQEREIISGV